MSETRRETLSAMLDNETDELELRRLLKAVGDDAELKRVWERYSLAQSLLHESRVGRVSNDFHLDVARRLQAEPTPKRGSGVSAPGRQFAGRFAIAATVALAVFVALQAGLDNEPAAPQIANEASAPATAPTAQIVEVDNAPVVPVDPEARQRLLEYIESMRFDPEEPPRMEHIQDSPLFHLVNDLQD